jgi:hypothetical protein
MPRHRRTAGAAASAAPAGARCGSPVRIGTVVGMITTHAPRSRRRRRDRLLALTLGAVLAVAATLALGAEGAQPPGPGGVPAIVAAAPATADGPEQPAATGLDPDLAARLAAAQRAAADDGVTLTLTSGWRTPEEQQRLVDDALDRYGDPAEAHRWVLPPETSAHVQGLAVDVGPTEGAYWLQEHGLEHGLCPTYANEVWHFEMLPAGAHECPEPHRDSSWGW